MSDLIQRLRALWTAPMQVKPEDEGPRALKVRVIYATPATPEELRHLRWRRRTADQRLRRVG